MPCYPSLEDLFARDHPDGVIVATPNALHVPNGLDCIQQNVPVLMEKPIADTVADGQRLCDAAERADVPLLVGHHRRHNALLARARAVVEAGTLGKLVAVIGSARFYKPERYFEEAPWRAQPGGGPILINLIHEVDDLRVLAGEIVGVQATASHATRGFAVEDTVAITLRFSNGALPLLGRRFAVIPGAVPLPRFPWRHLIRLRSAVGHVSAPTLSALRPTCRGRGCRP